MSTSHVVSRESHSGELKIVLSLLKLAVALFQAVFCTLTPLFWPCSYPCPLIWLETLFICIPRSEGFPSLKGLPGYILFVWIFTGFPELSEVRVMVMMDLLGNYGDWEFVYSVFSCHLALGSFEYRLIDLAAGVFLLVYSCHLEAHSESFFSRLFFLSSVFGCASLLSFQLFDDWKNS